MDFPQYRKLSNGRSFYEILSDRDFNELQIVGTRVFYYEHRTDKYPEILRIREMLDLSLAGIQLSEKQEFEVLRLTV